MRRNRVGRSAVALLVMVCFVTVGCTGTMMQQPGQAALICGAGGAAAGAAIGAAASRRWEGALIGAAAGALAGSLACFAVAQYQSRQVRDYRETQQATNYHPAAGDAIQITHYALTPAAAAPGTEIAFNATYHVMTPEPDREVPITEVRILRVHDPQTNSYRELGRVPNQVTVKPGTRQADGKFQVRSGVAEGNYQVVFAIAKDATSDTRELPLIVTSNQATLGDPRARIVEVSAPGAKRLEPGPAQIPPAAAPRPAAAPVSVGGQSLATLGEQHPRPGVPSAPSTGYAVPGAPAAGSQGAVTALRSGSTYFVASRVSGQGNLRAGPGVRHQVVGSIRQGDRFQILDRVTNPREATPWFKIRLDNGAEAWVAGSLGTEVHE